MKAKRYTHKQEAADQPATFRGKSAWGIDDSEREDFVARIRAAASRSAAALREMARAAREPAFRWYDAEVETVVTGFGESRPSFQRSSLNYAQLEERIMTQQMEVLRGGPSAFEEFYQGMRSLRTARMEEEVAQSTVTVEDLTQPIQLTRAQRTDPNQLLGRSRGYMEFLRRRFGQF